MGRERNGPEERAQDRVAGREPGVHGAAPAIRAGAAGCRRAARDHGAHPPLVGYLCERCLDAPALLVQPAPWGGEMGVCAACQQEPPAGDVEPHIR